MRYLPNNFWKWIVYPSNSALSQQGTTVIPQSSSINTFPPLLPFGRDETAQTIRWVSGKRCPWIRQAFSKALLEEEGREWRPHPPCAMLFFDVNCLPMLDLRMLRQRSPTSPPPPRPPLFRRRRISHFKHPLNSISNSSSFLHPAAAQLRRLPPSSGIHSKELTAGTWAPGRSRRCCG